MTRFAALLAGLVMFSMAGQASAGDTASLNVLGYSADGKVFAFEEYGVSDGAGFPYSNIYFIDTAQDRFLPGTPIRVRVEEEGPLGKVREMARAKAAGLTAEYRLADNPGVIVAYNPPSEIGSDPVTLRYYPYLSAQLSGHTYTLALDQREFPPSPDCLNMTGTYSGFTLRMTEQRGERADIVLHADSAVPKSRGCANDYRIGAVVSSEIDDVPQIAMIIVGSMGFEGDDRRWIAVPIRPYGP